MGRFAKEWLHYGALRAKIKIWGASRKNDGKNHSLKEEWIFSGIEATVF